MAQFALCYEYDLALAEARSDLLEEHRSWVASILDAGHLLAAGAFADGTGAVIVLEYPTLEEAGAVAVTDPFVVHGLVERSSLREWANRWGPWVR